MSNNVIQERIRERVIAGETVSARQLVDPGKEISKFVDMLVGRSQVLKVGSLDIALQIKHSQELSAWFTKYEFTFEANVYWVAYKIGYRLPIRYFLQNLYEIWYPSADDLIITNRNSAYFVTLSHEEVFEAWQPR